MLLDSSILQQRAFSAVAGVLCSFLAPVFFRAMPRDKRESAGRSKGSSSKTKHAEKAPKVKRRRCSKGRDSQSGSSGGPPTISDSDEGEIPSDDGEKGAIVSYRARKGDDPECVECLKRIKPTDKVFRTKRANYKCGALRMTQEYALRKSNQELLVSLRKLKKADPGQYSEIMADILNKGVGSRLSASAKVNLIDKMVKHEAKRSQNIARRDGLVLLQRGEYACWQKNNGGKKTKKSLAYFDKELAKKKRGERTKDYWELHPRAKQWTIGVEKPREIEASDVISRQQKFEMTGDKSTDDAALKRMGKNWGGSQDHVTGMMLNNNKFSSIGDGSGSEHEESEEEGDESEESETPTRTCSDSDKDSDDDSDDPSVARIFSLG